MYSPKKYKGTYAQILYEAWAENDLKKFASTLGWLVIELSFYALGVLVLFFIL